MNTLLKEKIADLESEKETYFSEMNNRGEELAALKDLVREILNPEIFGDGTLWLCPFCGGEGSNKVHRAGCLTQRPEVKALLSPPPKPDHQGEL